MLPLNTSFKTASMISTHLFTIAIGMAACTYSHTSSAICAEDSVPQHTIFKNNTTHTPVVSTKQDMANVAPELPFFKDVLSSKGLFW